MFNEHPFWKERYCPDHDSDGTHKCFSCERLEVSFTYQNKQGREGNETTIALLVRVVMFLFFFGSLGKQTL